MRVERYVEMPIEQQRCRTCSSGSGVVVNGSWLWSAAGKFAGAHLNHLSTWESARLPRHSEKSLPSRILKPARKQTDKTAKKNCQVSGTGNRTLGCSVRA